MAENKISTDAPLCAGQCLPRDVLGYLLSVYSLSQKKCIFHSLLYPFETRLNLVPAISVREIIFTLEAAITTALYQIQASPWRWKAEWQFSWMKESAPHWGHLTQLSSGYGSFGLNNDVPIKFVIRGMYNYSKYLRTWPSWECGLTQPEDSCRARAPPVESLSQTAPETLWICGKEKQLCTDQSLVSGHSEEAYTKRSIPCNVYTFEIWVIILITFLSLSDSTYLKTAL